jgi:molybdopterin adenylyltransferase
MNPDHVRSLKISCAIITVSSTRRPDTDSSGKAIQEILEIGELPVVHYAIVPDTIDAIRDELFRSLKLANCVIINGGTGLTHDDCTIEAVYPLLGKKIDGFGEMFRMKSLVEIGTSAMLSRSTAGIIHGRAVFCIPGSTPAVTLATKELIVPEIAHILSHANR